MLCLLVFGWMGQLLRVDCLILPPVCHIKVEEILLSAYSINNDLVFLKAIYCIVYFTVSDICEKCFMSWFE